MFNYRSPISTLIFFAVIVGYIVRAASIVSDILVIGVTWKMVKSAHQTTRLIGNTAPSLASTFLYQGECEFAIHIL